MSLSEEIKKHFENYKVEDLYLKNIADRAKEDKYNLVWSGLMITTSKETKIDVINKNYDCDFGYILDLGEKYENAINSGIIKKNSDGLTLNKTSVKTWLKKEDIKGYFDIGTSYNFGLCKKVNLRLKAICNSSGRYDILRKKFADALWDMYYKEVQYFNTHDVYKVEENKYKKNIDKYGSLGLDVCLSSEGVFFGKDEETIFDFNRKFTIDELKYLNNKYEAITKYIDSLSQEVKNNISYYNKDIEENKDEDIDLD